MKDIKNQKQIKKGEQVGNLKTIVNKTIYANESMIIKIDGAISKEISGERGEYATYDTTFFIKIIDKRVGSKHICLAKLAPHQALSMASHILDRIVGAENSNFEEITSRDQRDSIRAGIFSAGYGVQITSGSAPILAPLHKNGLRGFAELLRVTVQTCEHFAAVAKSKYEVRKREEAVNASRNSPTT